MNKILTIFSLCFSLSMQAQNSPAPFNGLITDIAGTPVKRARVMSKSNKQFTYSDKQGRFGFSSMKENDTLEITYKKTKYDIPVSGRKSLRLRLGDMLESNEDEELINYGYGYVKKREYTNSGSVLSGEALAREGYSSVMEAIRGRVPGLNIYGGTGMGETNSVSIRGINSINSSSTPLFLLDEVEVPTFDGVNLSDVERIEVIKDANIYGVKGANGVIKVTTKKGMN